MPPPNAVTQLVDADGGFLAPALDGFASASGLARAAPADYQVVAVMGPQSSGKSTLLNALFGTSFEEMDALAGRNQTTRGIWVAAAGPPPTGGSHPPLPPPPAPPLTLVLDLEGADGRERGEDDASFERQTALFAMAVADVLVVNMWAKDVGREAGAGKPLLRTIFTVDLKLRAAAAAGVPARAAAASAAAGVGLPPTPAPAKRVLLFAFRDRTRTPLPTLAAAWAADLEALWAGLAKPPGLAQSPLTDFFDVQYTALPNYEDAEDAFRAEVADLRARFDARSPDSLVRAPTATADGRLPGSALPLSLAKMWEVVRSQRDLNLPAHKVMVANLRCAELGDAALAAMTASPAFAELAAAAAAGGVLPHPGFGPAAAALVEAALAAYDADAAFFEAGAAADRRADLAAGAAAALAPAHARQLEAAACAALDGARAALMTGGGEGGGGAGAVAADQPFTARAAAAKAVALAAFDAAAAAMAWPDGAAGGDAAVAAAVACAWRADAARAGLADDVDALAAHLASSALADAEAAAGAAVRDALSGPAATLLDAAPADVWPRLGRLVGGAVRAASDRAAEAVAGYGHSAAALASLRSRIAAFGRGVVEARAREAAGAAGPRAKDAWADAFSRDGDGLPRSWAPGADVAGAAAAARAAAARVLGALAVVRLPEEGEEAGLAAPAGPDFVSRAVGALAAGGGAAADDDASAARPPPSPGGAAGFDLTVATEWPASVVPPAAVLLPPDAVRAAWRGVEAAADRAVRQAVATVEARAAAGARGAPPLWALVAIAVLGANEAAAALRSPLWLLALALTLLFLRTVYVELDVDSELARGGLLPGCIALAAKLGPTVRGVAGRTCEAVAGWVMAGQGAGGGAPYRGGFGPLGDAAATNGGGRAAAAGHGARPPPGGGSMRQRRPGGYGVPAAEVEMAGLN